MEHVHPDGKDYQRVVKNVILDPLEIDVLNIATVTGMLAVTTSMVSVQMGHVSQGGNHIHVAKFVTGDHLVSGVLLTAIVTTMRVVTTSMESVQAEHVQQDGKDSYAVQLVSTIHMDRIAIHHATVTLVITSVGVVKHARVIANGKENFVTNPQIKNQNNSIKQVHPLLLYLGQFQLSLLL